VTSRDSVFLFRFALADVGERSSEGSMTGDLDPFPWKSPNAPDVEFGCDRWLPLCILAMAGLLVLEELSHDEGECGWRPLCRCAMSSWAGGG